MDDELFCKWRVAEGGYKLAAGDEIVPRIPGGTERDYYPLEESDLYDQFAKIPYTTEGVLSFANRYGLLGIGRKSDNLETPQRWFREIEEVKMASDSWTRAYDRNLKESDFSPYEGLGKRIEASEGHRITSLRGAAIYVVYLQVKENRDHWSSAETYVWDEKYQRGITRIEPENLIAAIWHQLARKIDGGVERRRCVICLEPFEVGRNYKIGQHRYQSTHSDACKNRLSRRRKEVKPLLRSGSSRSAIVNRTDIDQRVIDFLIEEWKKSTKRKRAKKK